MGNKRAQVATDRFDPGAIEMRKEKIAKFKGWTRRRLTPSRHRQVVWFARAVAGWWYRNDLNELALIFGSDKWGSHWYTQHYQRYFLPLKHKQLNILEIGVGGYEDSAAGGESLRMWKAFFRKSRIVGIDIVDKTHFREPRIDIRQCNQTDSEELIRLCDEYGGFDIIIDDGSHVNEQVIGSFHVLFPRLRANGIYAVEDVQTAYWPNCGGGIGNPKSSMTFFKALVDGLNHEEYPIDNYQSNYFERKIVEIAFFHNLVLIRKGRNNEGSNHAESVQRESRALKPD